MRQFIKGMDVSFLDEIERGGGAFYQDGTETDMLRIAADHGVNAIRLRIWHDPVGGFCGTEATLKMAKRMKQQYGMHFLLDFHYSDSWADPGKQPKPAAWRHLSFAELTEAVYAYTKDVIQALDAQGTRPDMVQVGNEIINGMLWDDGKVSGEFDTDEQWQKLCTLIRAGLDGVHDAVSPSDSISTMIHIDRGADNAASRYFYDKMSQFNIDFDVIGQSYYPWWHGTLDELESNLHDLAIRYNKPVNVVEVAYPWYLPEKEAIMHRTDQLHDGYPATAHGQQRFLEDVMHIVANVPNGRGHGMYYWEPCWIPSKPDWSVGHANNWYNLTLFDEQGNALPSLAAYRYER